MDEHSKDVRFVEGVGFDARDADAGSLAIVTISTVLVVIGFVVGIYWFFTVSIEQVEYDQNYSVASKELIAIHDREDEQLHKYGYIDKSKGIVRLPVERAMQVIETEAAEGKPGWNTKTCEAKPELPGGSRGVIWKADGTNVPMPALAGSAPAPPAPAGNKS